MYGNTSRIAARSAVLRTAAESLRARAGVAAARAEACAWPSQAGLLLGSRVEAMVVDVLRQAQHLDGAADALEAHIRAVDHASARIAAAAQLAAVLR